MNTQKVSTVFLGIICVIAVGTVLKLTGTFVLPLVLALLLSIVLSPLVDLMHKIRIPRTIGILLVILLLLWVFYLIGLFLFSSAQSFVRQFPKYQMRFENLYQDLLNRFSTEGTPSAPFLAEIDWARMLSGFLLSWSGDFVSFMGSVGIILIFLFFLLLEKPYLKVKMQNAFQIEMTDRINRISDHIISQTGRYLTIKLVISLVTGVFVWLMYSIIGVDFAILWGSLAFLFNFIPNIGSILVGMLTFLFSFIQFYPSINEPILVGLTMLVIQNGMGSFLEPKLQGDSLNLSPVVILFSLLFWGWLWGITGMFLAVPLTVTIKIVCENIPFLHPVSIIMGTGKERSQAPVAGKP